MSKKLIWIIVLVLSIGALVAYGIYNRNYILGKKMDIEQLEKRVNRYIDNVNPNLEIGDIFIYNDSDYYFSIEEKDTGKGAMELLINPYTGAIHPEQGPNMMWNLKYGMMRGGHGMMGRNYYDNDYNGANSISKSDAVRYANTYVKENMNENYEVIEEGHAFYGYYTLHIIENEKTIGMISVNGFTAEIWYHNWHGTLVEVISHHENN